MSRRHDQLRAFLIAETIAREVAEGAKRDLFRAVDQRSADKTELERMVAQVSAATAIAERIRERSRST